MCLHHRIFLRALLGVFSRPSQSPRKPGFRTSDSPVLAVPWDGAAAPSNISSRDKISTSISLILTRPFVWCAGIIASKCPTSPDIPAKIERGVPRGRRQDAAENAAPVGQVRKGGDLERWTPQTPQQYHP